MDCNIYTFVFKEPMIKVHTFLIPAKLTNFMAIILRMKSINNVEGVMDLLNFLCKSGNKLELSDSFMKDETFETLVQDYGVSKLKNNIYQIMNPSILNIDYSCVNPVKCRILRSFYYIW